MSVINIVIFFLTTMLFLFMTQMEIPAYVAVSDYLIHETRLFAAPLLAIVIGMLLVLSTAQFKAVKRMLWVTIFFCVLMSGVVLFDYLTLPTLMPHYDSDAIISPFLIIGGVNLVIWFIVKPPK